MEKQHSRSLFWPVVLIGIGVIWLLGSLGIIPNANIGRLASLWPVILIVIGLNMLVDRRSPAISAVMGLFAIALVVLLLITGPSLGLPTTGTLKTETIASDIGAATTADFNLNISSLPVNIYALSDRTSLVKGQIDYYGTLNYSDMGTTTRYLRLEQESSGSFNIPWDPNARWKIGLSPYVPLALEVDGGSGAADLDLSQLRLINFAMDQGSGSLTLQLPPSTQPYIADLNGGSGSMNITFPVGGDITARIDGGSGSINLHLASGTAVQLEIHSAGSGSVNVPDWLQAVKLYNNGKEGTWKTAGFDQAQHKLFIICNDLGSGSFNIN